MCSCEGVRACSKFLAGHELRDGVNIEKCRTEEREIPPSCFAVRVLCAVVREYEHAASFWQVMNYVMG